MSIIQSSPRAVSGSEPGRATNGQTVRVAVLVNLFRNETSGGHVKCWEHFANAAIREKSIDLTIYFSGDENHTEVRSDNVRYRYLRPVFSTAKLPFLRGAPDQTDIAFYHPRLAETLDNYDVVHTTDAYFAFADTAVRVAGKRHIPLIHSVHTDTPGYTRTFTQELLEKTQAGRFLARELRLPERLERYLERKLAQHQKRAAVTFTSSPHHRAQAETAVPASQIRELDRGIDKDCFSPRHHDRSRLRFLYGIPEDRFLVAYAGRLDCCKNIRLFLDAFDRDWLEAHNIHLFFAGQGEARSIIAAHFGDRAIFSGNIHQQNLGMVLASADLLVFPSMLETFGNVVRESLASGTGVLLAQEGGMTGDARPSQIKGEEFGLYLPGREPNVWRETLAGLSADQARVRSWGRAAGIWAGRHLPTWHDVLVSDLLPVWHNPVET